MQMLEKSHISQKSSSSPSEPKKPTMPDVAKNNTMVIDSTIDKVGMSKIELPISLETPKGKKFLTPAKIDTFVSLDDPKAKGIHMSRLFLSTQETLTNNPLSLELLENLLRQFVDSHQGLSKSSFITISFDYMTERKSLKSNNKGWRTYPITVSGSFKDGVLSFDISTSIVYSSTCPCSAALARQLIQKQFEKDFVSNPTDMISRTEVTKWLGSSQGILATPHSQRSLANVRITLDNQLIKNKSNSTVFFEELISTVENSLKTSVQAVVKREDEQEFALLNGQNLMFCEDASRKIKKTLDDDKRIIDYKIHVEHLESLHPHDAVSIITKHG